MELETRNRASALTLLVSLSSFMILLIRPVGNSGRVVVVSVLFSSDSTIGECEFDWGMGR